MLIRIGFEIIVECTAPAPFLLALLPHPSYGGRLIGSDQIRAEPGEPLEVYLDPFGNRRARIVAPVGRLKLWSDCVVEGEGIPDPFDWNARQHEIAELPFEALNYLTASRYCEADELIERAWALFCKTPPGWARVQAICNWVPQPLDPSATISGGHPRPLSTLCGSAPACAAILPNSRLPSVEP